MNRRTAAIIIAVALGLAGCGNVVEAGTGAPGLYHIQAACKQVVIDFTASESVEFNKTISQDTYEFLDGTYCYLVDSNALYITMLGKIVTLSGDEPEDDSQTCTVEQAESMALEVFERAMANFLVKGGEIAASCEDSNGREDSYTIAVKELVNGVPTGTRAAISFTKAGLNSVCLKKGIRRARINRFTMRIR